MRNYRPNWDAIGITKARFQELAGFCMQYPEWRVEADSLLGVQGGGLDGMPHGSTVGDPVSAAAARRARLLRKIRIIEECAQDVDDGRWYAALILNVCIRKRYEDLTSILPTSNRNAFFRARREFFIKLNERKEEPD